MRIAAILIVVAAVSSLALAGQETKPVPNDSVRVRVPGCTKGYVFTAGPRTVDEPGASEIPEGMHLRMNGPKKLMAEIKAHQGSMIEITGLMKKGQYKEGIAIGGGVRVSPGSTPASGMSPGLTTNQIQIDVEGWRAIAGYCPSR
jgi:hypothetical protein